MASTRNTPAPQVPAEETVTIPAATEYTFEASDYATGGHRVRSAVPDQVADLLEDLREAHAKEVTDAKGSVIPAGVVKFKTVTLPSAEHGKTFAKHVRSYSKTVMYPEWSARLSELSPTTFRVGVGPVKPKGRRNRNAADVVTGTVADES